MYLQPIALPVLQQVLEMLIGVVALLSLLMLLAELQAHKSFLL
jgi:hypothetical protein